DEKGQKMSKSKGNIIDPVILMDKYGTDALRFTLTAMAAQGRDIKLSEQRVAGYRNFVTKLWNASRFGEMNECNLRNNFIPEGCKLAINRWIVGGTVETVSAVSEGIESYRFNDAADALYHFIWGTFCDWYLELIKPVLYGEDGPQKEETRAVFGWVLMQILRMLHPVTPFVTEELYQKLGDKEDLPLMSQRWPDVKGLSVDAEAKDELNWVVRLVGEIRSVRATMNVPPSAKIGLLYSTANENTVDKLKTHDFSIRQLAGLSTIEEGEGVSNSVAQIILDETTLFLALGDVIDITNEKARLQKEITKLIGEAGKIRKKLSNEEFMAQAPSHVIEKQRERLLEADQSRHKLEEAVGRLSSV
ncbi:MAG TPA: valine--tRNA ligase, partial [Alphaproteobacteria bacterium]|nr:valine--tRNA ligase [Alphaproteobacteria bacterium]